MRHTFRSATDEGAAAVEFALVSLVLVLFLVGIAQFGFTFFQYLEVVHSAREGARWAALGTETGSVSDPSSVRGRVVAAAPGLDPSLTDAEISVAVTGGGNEAQIPADSGKPVTVSVTYDSPIFLPLIGDIVGGGAFHLTSSATLRVE